MLGYKVFNLEAIGDYTIIFINSTHFSGITARFDEDLKKILDSRGFDLKCLDLSNLQTVEGSWTETRNAVVVISLADDYKTTSRLITTAVMCAMKAVGITDLSANKGKPFTSIVGYILGTIFREDWYQRMGGYQLEIPSNEVCNHRNTISFYHKDGSDKKTRYEKDMEVVFQDGQRGIVSFEVVQQKAGWWVLTAIFEGNRHHIQNFYIPASKDKSPSQFILNITQIDDDQCAAEVSSAINQHNDACMHVFSFNLSFVRPKTLVGLDEVWTAKYPEDFVNGKCSVDVFNRVTGESKVVINIVGDYVEVCVQSKGTSSYRVCNKQIPGFNREEMFFKMYRRISSVDLLVLEIFDDANHQNCILSAHIQLVIISDLTPGMLEPTEGV